MRNALVVCAVLAISAMAAPQAEARSLRSLLGVPTANATESGTASAPAAGRAKAAAANFDRVDSFAQGSPRPNFPVIRTVLLLVALAYLLSLI